MFRILLVLEDLNQLNAIKLFLTKLGCAVESQGTELGLKDRVISFRPDIVMTGGSGKKVNPVNVALKIREIKDEIKVIMVLAKGMKLSLSDLAENRYDAFIESPFDPIRLTTTLNKFRSKNSIDLVEKYQKLMNGMVGKISDTHMGSSKESHQEEIRVGSSSVSDQAGSHSVFSAKFSTSVTPDSRAHKYEDLTFGLLVDPVSTINKEAARSKVAELQKDWDQNKLAEIDKAKRQFVTDLFRKK